MCRKGDAGALAVESVDIEGGANGSVVHRASKPKEQGGFIRIALHLHLIGDRVVGYVGDGGMLMPVRGR
ncbi:hypothetical protein [Pontiella desulfatans]|uniref:hypothetical protein n=1 Tax=Pontiella desulfatans TaxID=2750659 RepID=UPI00109C86C9|nr:hypothetical protein [Pontiella desulfatans]